MSQFQFNKTLRTFWLNFFHLKSWQCKMCDNLKVWCLVSRVTCHMLHVTCPMSLASTATATEPPPASANSPYYAQQDAAADVQLDPSTMRRKDQQIYFFQCCYFRLLLNQNC